MTQAIPAELERYRAEIDRLDTALIEALSRRFEIVRAVGILKAERNMEVVQSKRAQAVIDRAAALAQEKNLDPALIRKIYALMIDHAHKLENDILETHASAPKDPS
ncbi:MAG: chorismate mutase [Alphaproteobacteria bacterium]|nr:chorismate mutase [Alphaproteobacteria bacterium]